jgi:hypothetical protein
MYSCCYATITGRNMFSLVMASKHNTNIWAITRQLLGTQVPTATVEILLDYNSGNGVFCWVHAEMSEAGSVKFQSRNCQQFI